MGNRIHAALIAAVMVIAAVPARADVVADWAELQSAFEKAANTGTPLPFDAVKYQSYGKVALAMFEAANAIDRRYVSYLGMAPAPAGASDVAAVDAAARDALAALYPGKFEQIDKAYVMVIDAVPAGPARDAGIAVGKAAAAAALAAGGRDPALVPGAYRPGGAPGKWVPSGVPFPPEAVTMRPWFMK